VVDPLCPDTDVTAGVVAAVVVAALVAPLLKFVWPLEEAAPCMTAEGCTDRVCAAPLRSTMMLAF